jgi:hypothetical protein
MAYDMNEGGSKDLFNFHKQSLSQTSIMEKSTEKSSQLKKYQINSKLIRKIMKN